MSTVTPHVSRELALRARERGASLLDAPVSGSVPQLQSGTLTDIAALFEVLSHLTSETTRPAA
jgi:3-hydroxyisobutyrate dehydrogenase-like beta-hydroxyacid dehydrogenase